MKNFTEHPSQMYLKNLVEILPYFIFWKDTQSVYLGCNTRFAQLAGKKSPAEVVGKTDFELNWGPGQAELFREGDKKTLMGHPLTNAEEIIKQPDGSELVVLVNKVSLLDAQGQCIGILGTSADITDFRNVELQKTEARLAGVRAISASMAHELRTPLCGIQFSVSGAQDYFQDLVDAYNMAKKHHLAVQPIHPKHLHMLSKLCNDIKANVQYAETIISIGLMNTEKKEEGALKIELSRCSMEACIRKAIDRYPFKANDQVDERNLIEWTLKKDFFFNGNTVRMVHILFNLIKNALYYIQFAKKGKIKIESGQNEKYNILYFEDTSKGIPEAELPKIFDRFYTTTRHGAGLGLAYCEKVMKSFHGSIYCESEEGQYTRFVLFFPKF